jgi:hypothetical protein
MDDVSLQFNLGSIWWEHGKLEFTLIVKQQGTCFMRALAYDPSNLRKSGISFVIGAQDYKMLKDIVTKTDAPLEDLVTTKNVTFTYMP